MINGGGGRCSEAVGVGGGAGEGVGGLVGERSSTGARGCGARGCSWYQPAGVADWSGVGGRTAVTTTATWSPSPHAPHPAPCRHPGRRGQHHRPLRPGPQLRCCHHRLRGGLCLHPRQPPACEVRPAFGDPQGPPPPYAVGVSRWWVGGSLTGQHLARPDKLTAPPHTCALELATWGDRIPCFNRKKEKNKENNTTRALPAPGTGCTSTTRWRLPLCTSSAACGGCCQWGSLPLRWVGGWVGGVDG